MIISYIIDVNILLIVAILISTLIGAIGGLNQNSLRKLLAFSSINHIGWIISAIIFNENLWLVYFLIYTFLNICVIIMFNKYKIFYLNQIYTLFMGSTVIKFSLLTSLLSLGGLPPFLGFIPKWLIIQSLIFIKLNFINIFIICISLITLFYYLKVGFAAFIINYNEFNWNYKTFYSQRHINIIIIINFISLFSFFLVIDLIYLY